MRKTARTAIAAISASLISSLAFSGGSGAEEPQRFTEEMLVEGAQQEKALLWYTACPPYQEVLKAFQDRYPFLKTDGIYLGGPTIAQRFYADKQRGVEFADVFTSGLTEVYPDLRAKQYLARMDNLPNWQAHPDWAKDTEGSYAFFQAIQHVIMYNTDQVTEEEAPTSYAELTDPTWKNKVALVDPDTGGMGVYLARFLAQHTDLGFAWMEKMRANHVHLSYQVGQLRETVSSGMRPVGLGRDLEVVRAKKAGAHVTYVLAKEGFPYQFYPVSVNSEAPHPYAARLFANWLLSEEGRATLEKEGYAVPRGDTAEMKARGAWILNVEGITPEETKEFKAKAARALKGA